MKLESQFFELKNFDNIFSDENGILAICGFMNLYFINSCDEVLVDCKALGNTYLFHLTIEV